MKDRIFRSATFATQVESKRPNDSDFYATRHYLPLIARILLSSLFLWSGVNKILHPTETQAYMTAYGMPLTWFFLPAAIVLEIGGSLSVLLGVYARLGAAALALFTFIATFIFHSNFANEVEQIMFLKNLSIIGGLLMIVQYGAGRLAWRLGQRR